MQQQVFTSKQATNMLSSLPLCICMDSVRGQSCIVLHTLSIRLATKCIAYTEYKASIVLSCKHCIQGQQCIVLHTRDTRLAMLCTAARKHNTSNVLHCMQGIQGWSYSVMHAQGPIPVMYSTHFNAFNTFQCIQHIMYCSAYRDWGRQYRPLHSVQPCYTRLALLRTALHHLAANFPSRILAATCALPLASCSVIDCTHYP